MPVEPVNGKVTRAFLEAGPVPAYDLPPPTRPRSRVTPRERLYVLYVRNGYLFFGFFVGLLTLVLSGVQYGRPTVVDVLIHLGMFLSGVLFGSWVMLIQIYRLLDALHVRLQSLRLLDDLRTHEEGETDARES